jgi:uncharacterized protein YggE
MRAVLVLWVVSVLAGTSTDVAGQSDTATTGTEVGRLCPPGTNVTGSTTASGDAERLVEPDVGRVSFAVVVTRNASSDAQQVGNTVLNETVAALLDLPFINESDIQTTQFSLLPNYENYGSSGQAVTNWTFTQGFATTVPLSASTDASRVGQVIDVATSAGGGDELQVRGTDFYLSKNTAREVLDDLRVEAVQRAMKTAAVLIGATGAQMGGVTRISDSSYIPYQSVSVGSSSMANDGVYAYKEGPVPSTVYEGTIEVSSSTSVTVEICM